jgi:hypothetical protein
MTDAMPTIFTSYDDFAHLRFQRPSPHVLLITIDRPEVLNAANERLHREFSEVWRVVDRDDSVAVSVITGAGRAFSAGGDLDMVERMTTDQATTIEQWRDAKAVVDQMLASVKPIALDWPSPCWPTSASSGSRHACRTGMPGSGWRPATMLPCCGRCCAGWPEPSTT